MSQSQAPGTFSADKQNACTPLSNWHLKVITAITLGKIILQMCRRADHRVNIVHATKGDLSVREAGLA